MSIPVQQSQLQVSKIKKKFQDLNQVCSVILVTFRKLDQLTSRNNQNFLNQTSFLSNIRLRNH